MLMDHSDSVFDCILTGMKMHFLSMKEYFAACNFLNSKQHLHQSGLSGSVFTYQRMDFSFVYAEIDIIVGQNAARINFSQVFHP